MTAHEVFVWEEAHSLLVCTVQNYHTGMSTQILPDTQNPDF
jgi:hypothetical protein